MYELNNWGKVPELRIMDMKLCVTLRIVYMHAEHEGLVRSYDCIYARNLCSV